MSEKILPVLFAPMEGITGYVFRNAHHSVYGGVAKYYTPFLSPGPEIGIPKRAIRDVQPENNRGVPLVPQILTKSPGDFLDTVSLLHDFGYREINLNLGCPSGTVVAKGKGSGMLGDPETLARFLDAVFEGLPRIAGDLELSVKTRIGRWSEREWPDLLEVFNRFPISELIVHPRIQKEFYKGLVHRDAFSLAAERAKMPLVFNGDLADLADIRRVQAEFPDLKAVMLGRGLLRDPALAERYQGAREQGAMQQEESAHGKEYRASEVQGDGPTERALAEQVQGDGADERARLQKFHQALISGYRAAGFDDRVIAAKLKELWFYLGLRFSDERLLKKQKKSRTLEEFLLYTDMLLESAELVGEQGG